MGKSKKSVIVKLVKTPRGLFMRNWNCSASVTVTSRCKGYSSAPQISLSKTIKLYSLLYWVWTQPTHNTYSSNVDTFYSNLKIRQIR